MGFDSGALAFSRFSVVGTDVPKLPREDTLEKFGALALREDELSTAEVDYGWCAGRHVFDGEFTVGNCVYNDCVHVGLRIDTNKVPSELKKAYVALEESATAANNPSGFASRKQKREARETAKRKIEEDLASGKFRRSRVTNVLWDMPAGVVYAAVSMSQREQLMELFERTHDLQLIPITAGSLALHRMETGGKRREYEDIVPTRFASLPGDPPAEYPWTAKGDTAKDFLGNEFLMWLWQSANSKGGEVNLGEHAATVMFSKSLDLDCAFGQSGKTGLKFETPTEMPEALEAVRAGKVPRKTGLTVALHGQLYTLSLSAEQLAISGLKLPEVEKADSPRVLFEERITLLRDFMKGFDQMYDAFLKHRGGDSWQGQVDTMRRWFAGKTKATQQAVAAVA
jgi:hypothetical protein